MVCVWQSASAARVGANKSNDYTYQYESIFGRTFDETPLVLVDWFNAAATLGSYGMCQVCVKSVGKTSVTLAAYNGSDSTVNLFLRVIAISRDPL